MMLDFSGTTWLLTAIFASLVFLVAAIWTVLLVTDKTDWEPKNDTLDALKELPR